MGGGTQVKNISILFAKNRLKKRKCRIKLKSYFRFNRLNFQKNWYEDF